MSAGDLTNTTKHIRPGTRQSSLACIGTNIFGHKNSYAKNNNHDSKVESSLASWWVVSDSLYPSLMNGPLTEMEKCSALGSVGDLALVDPTASFIAGNVTPYKHVSIQTCA